MSRPSQSGSKDGQVVVDVRDAIATVTFSHPKSNSLPSALLKKLADEIKNKKEERDRQMKRVIEIRRDGEPDHLDGRPNETGLSDEPKKHGEKR